MRKGDRYMRIMANSALYITGVAEEDASGGGYFHGWELWMVNGRLDSIQRVCRKVSDVVHLIPWREEYERAGTQAAASGGPMADTVDRVERAAGIDMVPLGEADWTLPDAAPGDPPAMADGEWMREAN